MAITRTQIAKQLLANGGRTGFRVGTGEGKDTSGRDYGGGVGRSDRDSQYGGGDYDSSQNVSGRGLTNFTGRDPTKQFSPEAQKIAREMLGAKMGAGDRFVPNFFPIAKALANRFQVSKPTPFDLQRRGFIQALNPQTTNTTGGEGAGQELPTWAQLGYSSEAEYLAALARGQAPSIEEQEPEEDEGLRLAFRADGGPIGGEYDFESARQMYGLGKLVKKVTRTVKKIAKSPIGKAALLYGGAAGLGSFGRTGKIFSSGMFKPTNIMSGLFGLPGGSKLVDPTPGIFGKLGLTKGGGSLMPTVLGGIATATVASGLLTPEQEEEAQALSDSTGFSIEEARNSILARARDDYKMDFRARGFRAEGGIMRAGYQEGSKEPVAKKTMPLLDMDGQEMDLRAEGGFVPIGRMEKADDVPARLSKNEAQKLCIT